jgi:tRNA(Ile)-lysidine synthase
MALTLLAHSYVQARGGHIAALTVDHKLRTASTQEAEQVAAWMHARGIAQMTLTPEHPHVSNNTMNAARIWRYDALAEWCSSHHVLHCLIAHHADDQAETVALHTARGETEDGPSGMARARNYRAVRFLRPLLSFTKAQLQDYLREQNVTWIEDPTNHDTRYARARLRDEGVPTLKSNADERTQREQEAARAAIHCVTLAPHGIAQLALGYWRALPEPVATQLLADLIRCVGEETLRPRKYQTQSLAAALRAAGPCKRTLGGCLIESDGALAHITREHGKDLANFKPAKPLAAAAFW